MRTERGEEEGEGRREEKREGRGEKEATRTRTGPEVELTYRVKFLPYIHSAAYLQGTSILHFHIQKCVRGSYRQLLVRSKVNAETLQNTTIMTMDEHLQ